LPIFSADEEEMMTAFRPRALLLLTVLCLMSLAAQSRPKVGLVLSGGGAKGFAHIETLKLIDSLAFPVDYIAGTSMGGIAAALYAIGYSGKEIEDIVYSVNWVQVFNDKPRRELIPILEKQYDAQYGLTLELRDYIPAPPSGFISGQEIMKLFSQYTNPVSNITDFDDFAIPFRCVAVDLISGQEVAIDSGYLALAMRSTMSIPSAFAPVEYGNYLFVDGGVANNLPVDVAKDMGAEFVIAVNVGAPPLRKDEIRDVLDVTLQTIFIPGFKREKENIERADIVIAPPLANYTPADFAKEDIRAIINAGRKAAQARKDTLIELMRSWGMVPKNSTAGASKNANATNTNTNARHSITEVKIVRNEFLRQETIRQIAVVDSGAVLEEVDLEEIEQRLTDSQLFITNEVDAKIVSDSTAKLQITVREKLRPIIHRIEIHGNQQLSFPFIYHLLNVKPGDRFDYETLNRRVDEMYSLGHFRLLYYTLTPSDDEKVVLHLWVNERGHERLQFGLNYIEEYHFVASVGLLLNSFILDGVRARMNLQFAGFTRFTFQFSYPSLQLDNFSYPFLRVSYLNIDENFYNPEGFAEATINSTESTLGGGLGFLIGRSMFIEGEVAHHFLEYDGQVGAIGRSDSSSTVILGRLHIDNLDNAKIPTSGLLLHANYFGHLYPVLEKGLSFYRLSVQADYYQALSDNLNLRLMTYLAYASGEDITLPYYFKQINPNTFFGMRFHQLRYTQLATLGMRLRYRLNSSFYIYPLANLGFGLKVPYYEDLSNSFALIEAPNKEPFWAAGFGLTYNSILGTVSVVLGSRDKNPLFAGSHEFWTTFNIGVPL
jgi:predicted acylesterase/phospholipase RssA